MPSKPLTDPWTLIPTYWQVEVPRLLNSKDDFLGTKKRSSAGATELATLYEELEAAWDELTLRPSNAMLELLRKRAKRLQLDLELLEQELARDETSVTNDLATTSENELQSAEKRLQRRRERLLSKRKLLTEKSANWSAKYAQQKRDCNESLLTLKAESNERKVQLKTSVAESVHVFETNASGAETSLVELDEKQQQLLAQQLGLTQFEQNLKERRAALPVMQQQLDADLIMQQQNSEKSSLLRNELKSKLRDCAELKARLLSLGLIQAVDFPDL